MTGLTALVLAGGKGSRLAPWSAPKCLMPVRGVTILHRLLEHIDRFVERTVICVGYRAQDIRRAFSADRKEGLPVPDISDAGEDAGMMQRLIRARLEFKIKGRVLVCYGDELADVDIEELVRFHDGMESKLTFTGFRQPLPFGVLHGKKIEERKKVTVNIGFAIVEPECWRFAKLDEGFSQFINRVSDEFDTGCFMHRGKRATINSLHELETAEQVWV